MIQSVRDLSPRAKRESFGHLFVIPTRILFGDDYYYGRLPLEKFVPVRLLSDVESRARKLSHVVIIKLDDFPCVYVDREKTKSGASICFGDNSISVLSDDETATVRHRIHRRRIFRISCDQIIMLYEFNLLT